MLVDLGRNDVAGSLRSARLRSRTLWLRILQHVMHLVSNVEGQLKQGCDVFMYSGPAFLRALYGSSEGARNGDNRRAEPTKRGVYAGSVGYFSYSGNMDTCIAIRTLVIRREVFFQTGAGIVADSVPENEYWESVIKLWR